MQKTRGKESVCVHLSGRSLLAGQIFKQSHETHMTSLCPGTCAQSSKFNRGGEGYSESSQGTHAA